MASRPNRSSAAASRRSSKCATASRCWCVCRRSTSLTTRPASRSASTQHIGRRPIAAFGNSDGDQQMLEWTQAGGGARLMMLVHHDDADARVGLRRGIEDRHVQRRAHGRGEEERLDRHQHEERLEEDFCVRTVSRSRWHPTLSPLAKGRCRGVLESFRHGQIAAIPL